MSKTTNMIGLLVVSAVLCVGAMAQQPYVYSIVNAASYSRSIAPGSIFVVFGSGLGPASLVQAPQPFPLNLQGISVQITVGGTSVSCPMLYASSGQLAAVLPSNVPTGEGEVVVSVSGQPSWPTSVKIVTSAFGIFTPSGTGAGAGSITSADYKLNVFSVPATRGQVIILWGTGIGSVAGDDGTMPKPGTSFDDVEVLIGNQNSRILYAGRSGCCAGLDQIAVEVPEVPLGCFIPVAVRRAGETSNFVTLSVAAANDTCKSEIGMPVEVLQRFVALDQIKSGAIAIGPVGVLEGAGFSYSNRIATQLSAALKTRVDGRDVQRLARARLTGDRRVLHVLAKKYSAAIVAAGPKGRRALLNAQSGFGEMGVAAGFGTLRTMQYFGPAAAAALPDSGTCTVISRNTALVSTGRSRMLDAGTSLTYEGPNGVRTLTRDKNGQYLLSLGSDSSAGSLPAGHYQVSGNGGKDIPAFRASLTVSAPLVWTNKSALGAIDRSQPLTVTWSGGPDSGHVVFGLTAGDWDSSNVGLLVCVEEARKGALTVPALVMATLGPTQRSYAFIGPHPLDNRISIPGLDLAYIANGSSDYRNPVTLR